METIIYLHYVQNFFWNLEVHMLLNEKGQKHLVRGHKRSVGEQERMVIGQTVRESHM